MGAEALMETRCLHGVRRQTLYLHGTVQCSCEAPLDDHRIQGMSGHLIRGDSVWRTSTLTLDRVWVVGDADRRLAGAGRPVGGSDTFYRMIDSGHVAESPIGAATRTLDNVIYSSTGTA